MLRRAHDKNEKTASPNIFIASAYHSFSRYMIIVYNDNSSYREMQVCTLIQFNEQNSPKMRSIQNKSLPIVFVNTKKPHITLS